MTTSKNWLRNWCKSTGEITYEHLITVMDIGYVLADNEDYGYRYRWELQGDYLISVGVDNSASEIPLEVWTHVENILGKKLSSYPSHFSCSC